MPDEEKGYSFFDHTADIGIQAQGATLGELFINMAQGVIALIAEDSVLQPKDARPIHLSGDDPTSLLLRWLQELLFWFSTDRFLPVQYEVDVTPTSVHGTVRGARFDPARHTQGREVKAITRHQLEVTQQNGVWRGRVIVDI